MSRWSGPGLVFSHFDTDAFNDPTLSVAAYPFNTAENDAIPGQTARWAAVFVNAHYEPFLSRRFPEAKWFWVGKDQEKEDGGKALGIIPILPQNKGVMRHWAETYAYFRKADLRRYWQNKEDFNEVIKTLEAGQPTLKGDPFLESVYWEKMAAYEYGNTDYEGHLRALQAAVQTGYPAAHLYYQLGILLAAKNRLPEAKQALEKASQNAFNQTPSVKTAKTLAELEKRGLTLQDLYRSRK
jgi:tetratricopeptide (TPR) repeat protein